MEKSEAVYALNEWMRRYIENPKEFSAEFQTVQEFLADEAEGKEPSYGETGAEYMFRLLEERTSKA